MQAKVYENIIKPLLRFLMANYIKCACIIPCFNEEKRIKAIFQELNDINIENIDWFILDNGSTDNGFQIIEETNSLFNKKNIFIIRKS